MPLYTLLDIAKANGTDAVAGLIDESVRAHPEISQVPARTIRGTSYRTLVRTSAGTGNAGFRAANAGVVANKSTTENRLVETFIMEDRVEADKAVADRFEDGAPALLAMEASAMMERQMQALGRQFFYGTNATHGQAAGHPGLLQSYSTDLEVDAAGTTADTGSSVWLVKFGPKDVQWVFGNNGELKLGNVREELLTDPADATKRYDGYVQVFKAYPGVQVGSLYSVCRIKKLTADSGKGLTDARLAEAVYKMQDKSGFSPDAIFMSFRSRYQLQASRTVTLFGGSAKVSPGAGTIAPVPTEYDGIPIFGTNSISNTESLSI